MKICSWGWALWNGGECRKTSRGKGQTAAQVQPIGLGSGSGMVLQNHPKSGWEGEVFILSPESVGVCGPQERASIQLISVQSLSHVQFFATPWTAARYASLSITNSQSFLKPMSIESVMPSNNLTLCDLLLLPSVFPSIRVFSKESVLHIRWPKYWSFSFSISLSNEYSGLISFRMDWFDLLAVQGTLKSLLQQHSLKASFLPHSAFFIVQLSYPYTNTGKTIALTRQSFIRKGMGLGKAASSSLKEYLSGASQYPSSSCTIKSYQNALP